MDSSEGVLVDIEISDELEAKIEAFAAEQDVSFDGAVEILLRRYLEMVEG